MNGDGDGFDPERLRKADEQVDAAAAAVLEMQRMRELANSTRLPASGPRDYDEEAIKAFSDPDPASIDPPGQCWRCLHHNL